MKIIGITVNFLSNALGPLIIFIIILVIFLILMALSAKNRLGHMRMFAGGFLFSFFYIVVMDIALACFLQFNGLSFDEGSWAAGTVMAFLFMAVLIGFMVFILVFAKRKKDMYTEKNFRWRYGMLYQNCKFKKFSTRAFLFFNFGKKMFIAACIALLYPIPVIQAFGIFFAQLLVSHFFVIIF